MYIRSARWFYAIILTFVLNSVLFPQEKLMDSPQGKIVQAYIEAFNSGDEGKMRTFFLENISKEGLAQRPAEARLERYRMMKTEMQSLKLEKVLSVEHQKIAVLLENGKKEKFTYIFEFEENPPYKLETIAVEMGEMSLPSGPPLTRVEAVAEIEQLLAAQVQADQFSGTVLVVKDSDVLVKKAYGFADKRYQVPNQLDTKYNLGSINKFFTRVAIGQLMQPGKLSLDDLVVKHFPEYPNKEVAEKVKIKNLLEMSSGMGDFFGKKFEETPKNEIRSLKDYLPFFVDDALLFEPGSQRRYSNVGYILLGLIIEKVTGKDYYQYMKENVFLPAGMKNTDWYEMDAVVSNIATGYEHAEGTNGDWVSNIYSAPARGSSAGGGYSTVDDLYSFVQAMQEGKILSPSYVAWLLTGQLLPNPPSLPYKRGGIGVAGGANGINAVFDYEADTNTILVVLANYDPPAAEGVARAIRGFVARIK